MVHEGQFILSAEFQLHRRLYGIGNSALYRRETLCPPFCAAGSRRLYAAVPRRHLPREYADRGVLVLSVSRHLRCGDHPLRRGKDLRPAAVRARLVRLRLLDGHGTGFSTLQATAEAA